MQERWRLILALLLLPALWVLQGADSFVTVALAACGFGLIAGFLSRDSWVIAGGSMLAGAVLWLWAACGFPDGMEGAGGRLNAMFDRFDAALPLALVLGCAAIWLIAVPAGHALRPDVSCAERLVIAGCVVPFGAFLFLGRIVGSLVARGAGEVGWSMWQDVVAQFCLPVGAIAAVGCGMAALIGVRGGSRMALWMSASSGGLVLMALGRADAGGLSAGWALALAQWMVFGAWVLVGRCEGRAVGWRTWGAVACAASLAGVWPLPGGLARWRLFEEITRGGFGMSWDRALLAALVLSWATALLAWSVGVCRMLARKYGT